MSEAVALHVAAIDSAAMRVVVASGEGHKDRYTILSQRALEALRDYWRAYRPQHPDGWLFPGPGAFGHITSSEAGLPWRLSRPWVERALPHLCPSTTRASRF